MKLVTQIDKNVFRFNNQYFYGEKVGVYLIELSNKVVLFDVPTYTKEIFEYLKSFEKPLVAILSHGSTGIADGSIWQEKLGLKIYLHKLDQKNAWLNLKPDVFFEKEFEIEKTLKVITTPGHSLGSVCLFYEKEKIIFTGDTFGGEGNGLVRNFLKDGDGNLKLRFKSCKELLKLNFEKALPFHYEMILNNAKDKLKDFIYLNSKSI